MQLINLPILLIVSIVSIFLGIFLGALFGQVGSFQIISFILRIPAILIKSPKELKLRLNMIKELKERQKIERLKKIEKIKMLKERLKNSKKESKSLRVQINKTKGEKLEW